MEARGKQEFLVMRDNGRKEIIEIFPDSRSAVRFVPVSPEDTPKAIEELCLTTITSEIRPFLIC